MTDNQEHICFDCKHHIFNLEWHSEDFCTYESECVLGHKTSPIDEIKCEDFEYDR